LNVLLEREREKERERERERERVKKYFILSDYINIYI